MNRRNVFKAAAGGGLMLALGGCGSFPARVFAEPPRLGTPTSSADDLRNLPAPRRPLDVAVFAFTDQTGQYRPNASFAEFSFAVTQGGAAILTNSLQETGRGRWFNVVERNRLPDLLQERQIVRANRAEFPGPDGRQLPPLPPLRNAGILLTGGIIGYDTNTLTGGLGASYLGIGGNVEYRRDTVAVYLRAVSVTSGLVLASVTTEKTIYSAGLQGFTSRFVGFNRLMQIEGGITTNEPRHLAVRQAIEKAVHALVLEGASRDLWQFENPEEARELLEQHRAARNGGVSPQFVAAAEAARGAPAAQ